MAIPKRVQRRILESTRKFRPVLEQAKARDINEADTVTIVKAMLQDVFGWDPFFEVTSEYQIRGTYVDLAVKTDEEVSFLVEVKAIGKELQETYLRQAVGYAANHGVEWVVLTNGERWQARRVVFQKPVSHELVFELNFLEDDQTSAEIQAQVFLLTKEGMTKSASEQFHAEKQAMSRYNLGAVLQQDEVLLVVRRELRRAYPDLHPSIEQLRDLLVNDVLKREVLTGEKAETASKVIGAANRKLRKRSKSKASA